MRRRPLRLLLPAAPLLAAVAIGACGSSAGLGSGGGSRTSASASGAGMSSMGSGGSSSGSGMNIGSASGASVDGITPIPTQILGTATWQGMRIRAQVMTAVPFLIPTDSGPDGTGYTMVKPTKHTSFHLMVDLTDAQTGVPIPYSSVWATFTQDGRTVYDERQWPMLSRYMGPHYGNDVTLPGAGRYQVTLLISPPVAARHIEYKNVWLAAHRVTMTLDWQPKHAE